MRADVTVICAVWHRQQDKEALLRGHMENLARAGVGRVIYVFDGGDRAPEWLQGSSVAVGEPLSIYQAWNVALSMVSTPLVMNLNIDDRLATDAVAHMAAVLDRDPDVFLVGGDWRICFTAGEADAAAQSQPISVLPYRAEWPPAEGIATRLGSGDGARETHGPACMWRLEAHRRMPRYPYRFADGSLIRIIGDAIWWHAIEHYMRKKIVRLPLIIGNYRSQPASQAEFRHSAVEELGKQDIAMM